jgi:hypothetical protein
MKQFFSQSLAHGGKRRSRVIWLAMLPLAMSLVLAFTPIASSAFAATNRQLTSKLAAHPLALSTSVPSSQMSAGVTCQTQFHENREYDGLGFEAFWLKVQTTWCYNYVTVTSHSTILYWGTTTNGALAGWHYVGNPYYTFNCYIAAGSSINCSGNHEHADELWTDGSGHCHLIVDEEENYHGQFFWEDSKSGCY